MSLTILLAPEFALSLEAAFHDGEAEGDAANDPLARDVEAPRVPVAAWRHEETAQTGIDTDLADRAARFTSGDGGAPMPLCIALPGEESLSRIVRLPMKRSRDLQRAAALALDDAQALPMEDRLIAVGPADDEQARLVAATERSAVLSVLEAARAFGFDPDIVTIDHALLPPPEEADDAVALALGSRTLMRTVDGAFTAETAFADFAARQKSDLARSDITVAQLALPEMGRVPNFRTGSLAKRRPLPDVKPYLAAASLVLVAGILTLAATLVEGLRFASAAERIEGSAEAAFTQAYPGQPIVDLERQLSGRRVSTGPTDDFLPLTSVLADLLSSDDQTSLISLTYNADGELAAEIAFAAIADLEALTEALSERGLMAEEGSDTRRSEGVYVTRLFLRAAS
ncbi:MAG: type II secretion system protein GspL [Pseudomonadota bacterium]